MSAFTILAEPNRRRLLDQLRAGPKSVNALVAAIGMRQPVVSKHLRIMKEAGLVSVEAAGQQRIYRVNPEPLLELENWLAPYRHYWADKLDDLEQHLDDNPETPS